MALGNLMLIIFLCIYTKHLIMIIFRPKKRKELVEKNKKLKKLREIPIKNIDEQKKFLDLKYPKKNKFVFKWSMLGRGIFILLMYFALFKGFRYLIKYLGIEVALWQGLLIIIIGPLIINYILRKFDLQGSDTLNAILR